MPSWSFSGIGSTGYGAWQVPPGSEPWDFPSTVPCNWNIIRRIRRQVYNCTTDGEFNSPHAAFCPTLIQLEGGIAEPFLVANSGRVGWRQVNWADGDWIEADHHTEHELRFLIAEFKPYAGVGYGPEVGQVERVEVRLRLSSPDEIAPLVDVYLFGLNADPSFGYVMFNQTWGHPYEQGWDDGFMIGNGSTMVHTSSGQRLLGSEEAGWGTYFDNDGVWVDVPIGVLAAGREARLNGPWVDVGTGADDAWFVIVPRALEGSEPPEVLPAAPGELRRFVYATLDFRITYRTVPSAFGVLRVKDQTGAWLNIACDHGPGVLRLLAPDPLPAAGGIPAGWNGNARWYTVCPDPSYHGLSATGAFNLKAPNPLPMLPGQTGGPGVQWLQIGCMLPGALFSGNPT